MTNMKIKLFSLLLMVLCAGFISAQEPVSDRPHRTPQEEAMKQTLRLVRELGIRDSVRFDTIYRMHLKYAVERQQGLTRAQNLQRMQSIYDELKMLLTTEEFERFMNHPAEQPRRPHGANRMMPASATPIDATPSTPATHNTNQ